MVKRHRFSVFILLVIIVLFNIIIFPMLSSGDSPQILDTRYFYNREDISDYLDHLPEKDRTMQIIMHASVDIIYPAIYSVVLGALIAGRVFLFLPFLLFLTDVFENILIILLLTVDKTTAVFSAAAAAAPVITNIKWDLVGLNIATILALWIIRAVKQK